MIGALLGGLLLGWMLFSGNNASHQEHTHGETPTDEIWTCSMHPSIRNPEPGACPICGMDLIPLQTESGQSDPRLFEMQENALRLANVQTMKVGFSSAQREVRLNGRVVVDERNFAVQTADVSGRIEQLMVNFTGEKVNRGQALARVYSPELLTAQKELLQAATLQERMPELLEAAKEKLKHWRISEEQINNILERQEVSETFVLASSAAGVVREKLVDVGDFVERGEPIYEIADLSKLWVLLDVYENMSWIQVGDSVVFTVASLPGKTFEGAVSFIDPVLNDQTRVSTARIEVDNSDGQLKPEMFVSGIVKTEALGEQDQLTIPKSAVLWTGERSVVYIKEPNDSQAVFGLREVVLGALLGDKYVIQDGLIPGEEVVVNGAFTVDAAAQLAGKPSMMSPAEDRAANSTSQEEGDLKNYLENHLHHYRSDVPANLKQDLQRLVENYLKLKDALVVSNEKASLQASKSVFTSLESLETSNLSSEARDFLKARLESMVAAIGEMISNPDLETQRNSFDDLSVEMTKVLLAFGTGGEKLYVEYCPMANSDQGAFWLSANPQIQNPYYGDAMLGCGELISELE